MIQSVIFTLVLLSSAVRASSANAVCCRGLADALPSVYHGPASDEYGPLVASRWSNTSIQHPGCVVTPTSANEMSSIVRRLVANQCRFSVKSGGHNPNPGFNNIDGAVSIDLVYLNSTELSYDKSYVSLGTGLSWGQAYAAFEKDNISFTGGICEDVGVGGLAVGGGQSLFQAGKGWVVDNIIDYEVCLASGEIVHANQTNNTDLFKALKGGSTNFGIVISIKLAAFAFSEIWGGQLLFLLDGPQANHTQMLDAITNTTCDFVSNNHADIHSGVQIVTTYLRNGTRVADVALSNTANVANSPAHQPFFRLPNLIRNTNRHTSLSELAHETSNAIPRGFRYVTASITVSNDKDTLRDFWVAVDDVYNNLDVKDQIDWLVSVVPQPQIQQTFAASTGGNILGLGSVQEDQLVLWLVSRWNDPKLDWTMNKARQDFIDASISVATARGTYSPFVYLNYASPEQDPLCGYGADNVAFMKEVARKYDPTGVFQNLQPGGFKLDATRCTT